MSTTRSRDGLPASPNGGAPTDPAALRSEIERTRADLGHTVEALAAKADVKARAHETVAEMKSRARDTVEAARLRARDGLQQTATSAVYAAREMRANPGQQMRLAVARLRRSFAEHPAPWVVAGGLVTVVLLVMPRRWRR
jgi:hypothetical protein